MLTSARWDRFAASITFWQEGAVLYPKPALVSPLVGTLTAAELRPRHTQRPLSQQHAHSIARLYHNILGIRHHEILPTDLRAPRRQV